VSTTVELDTITKEILDQFMKEQTAKIKAETQEIEAQAKTLQIEAPALTKRMEVLGVPTERLQKTLNEDAEVARKTYDQFMVETKQPPTFKPTLLPPLVDKTVEPKVRLSLGKLDEKLQLPELRPMPDVRGTIEIRDRVHAHGTAHIDRHDYVFVAHLPWVQPHTNLVRVQFHGLAHLIAGLPFPWNFGIAGGWVHMTAGLVLPRIPRIVQIGDWDVIDKHVHHDHVHIPIDRHYMLPVPAHLPEPTFVIGRISLAAYQFGNTMPPFFPLTPYADLDFMTGPLGIRIDYN
jgi:hypothetical protein